MQITGIAYLLAIAIVSSSGAALSSLASGLSGVSRLDGVRDRGATSEESLALSRSSFGSSIFDGALTSSFASSPSFAGSYTQSYRSILEQAATMGATNLSSQFTSFQNAGQRSVYNGYIDNNQLVYGSGLLADGQGNVSMATGSKLEASVLNQGSIASILSAVNNDRGLKTVLEGAYSAALMVGSSKVSNFSVVKGASGYEYTGVITGKDGRVLTVKGVVGNDGISTLSILDGNKQVLTATSKDGKFHFSVPAVYNQNVGKADKVSKNALETTETGQVISNSESFNKVLEQFKENMKQITNIRDGFRQLGVSANSVNTTDSKSNTQDSSKEKKKEEGKKETSGRSYEFTTTAGMEAHAGIGTKGLSAGAGFYLDNKASTSTKFSIEKYKNVVETVAEKLSESISNVFSNINNVSGITEGYVGSEKSDISRSGTRNSNAYSVKEDKQKYYSNKNTTTNQASEEKSVNESLQYNSIVSQEVLDKMNELGAKGDLAGALALFLDSAFNSNSVRQQVEPVKKEVEGLKGNVENKQEQEKENVKTPHLGRNNPLNKQRDSKNPKNPKKPIVDRPTPPPAKPSKNSPPKQGDNNTPPVDKKTVDKEKKNLEGQSR